MRKAFVLTLMTIALACSDREQTGPSAIPPPSSPPAAPPSTQSRVVLSGTVYAAENGSPIPNVQVQIVEGVNAGRSTVSNDGTYQLADLEPGTFTVQFTTSEYRDLRRTEVVRANATLDVQLERKGLTLSGRITTQWGEPIHDAGVEARSDSGARGGGTSYLGNGTYRIPTLPPANYVVRVLKWGYVTPERSLTMTGDTTLDFMLDRVRVSLYGTVREAAPCSGAIQDARVEIVSGPDAGFGIATTATGYRTTRSINWGTFTLRATKAGYAPAEASMDIVPPGSQCQITMPNCPYVSAPSEIQQDFVLQRTGGC
jgi:hypothetical protein